jgi:hypothetical protein
MKRALCSDQVGIVRAQRGFARGTGCGQAGWEGLVFCRLEGRRRLATVILDRQAVNGIMALGGLFYSPIAAISL